MPAFNLPPGAAYVVITALTGTIYTLLVFLIRLFIRLKINPPFGPDDLHCALATLFTLLDASLVLTQTAFGLGHHADTLSPAATNTQRVLAWLAVLAYLQATTFSLLSVTFLIVRVTRLTTDARPAYLLAACIALWSLTATTIVCFQCRLPFPWRTRPHSRCIDIYAAWLFITASRALLEAANVLLAALLLCNLRMPVRPKVTVVAMFALRLLVIPPAVTRLRYIEISWHSADWSYARINVQIITQVSLHVSTILATVPCVKNFLLVFESGNLHPRASTQLDTSGGGGGGPASPRVSKRRSSLYALRTIVSRPTLAPVRRAKSAMDVLPRRPTPHIAPETADATPTATATRPGPMHTLRMNTWSAPERVGTRALLSARLSVAAPDVLFGPATAPPAAIPGGPGLLTLTTAEHDPEDARAASMERRASGASAASGRISIKRTWSWRVDAYWLGEESGEGVVRPQERAARASREERRSGGELRPGAGTERQRKRSWESWSSWGSRTSRVGLGRVVEDDAGGGKREWVGRGDDLA